MTNISKKDYPKKPSVESHEKIHYAGKVRYLPIGFFRTATKKPVENTSPKYSKMLGDIWGAPVNKKSGSIPNSKSTNEFEEYFKKHKKLQKFRKFRKD